MKHHIKSIIRGVILITLGLLCKNNVWYFDPEFGNGLLIVGGFIYIWNTFGLLKKKMENGFGRVKNRPNPRL